ncbi:(Pyruvate dehydrogenase (acetyl-transferring))-phosphatase 1 [Lasiodiplodia hormozganensis]|uniref:(Pyruvate dehydrogenase (Acetyl-transferring))-phosphatase 1 n=1 Tax=Lasiodiplodia hormozganensis TaxID=869390 RepID=A0AA39YP64_9PEZI|nr:(Pyruvate dehydrogenase (acetyl-transferring))-phosphatase 1 [Lasiodiplodia hormozganensis]
MRRAALQTCRAVRRPGLRRGVRTPGFVSSRAYNNHRQRSGHQILQSSMQFRTLGYALVSTAVATGAWLAYRGDGDPLHGGSPVASVSVPGQQTRGLSASSVYTNAASTHGPTSDKAPDGGNKVLVIHEGQVFTGTLPADAPLSKETDDYGRKVVEMLTPEQATQKLRRNEESWLVGRGKGVVRYDVVQIPSNDPIEDDHAEKIIEVPQSVASTDDGSSNSDWMFWGVFDGHSGWITSAKLRNSLISFVARELNATYKSALADPSVKLPTAESIDKAIKTGFLRLDHEIVHESVQKVMKAQSKRVAAELLAPALAGSCGLLSFYDSNSKLLRVACTGDSRAVLGRRGSNGKWTATPLSVDQTGGTEEEAARLRREHPGEPDVTRNGRILGGLEPSRAFGDAVYKWSIETQRKIKEFYFGRSSPALLKTPPYVTAEPVVTTTKVQPEKGDFVVMATDGLWEMLTNEEVVGLVGQWLESQAEGKNGQSNTNAWLKSWFSQQKGLPIEKDGLQQDMSGQRAPIRQRQWGVKGSETERFIVEDKNAATHLVRNALGGKNQDQLCALLTLPSPFSRRYRDDLTVEVIFFGEGENTGTVTLNKEASASGDVKAKL